MRVTVELCVHDLEGARIAREVGADRVEVCVDISAGGLTPPLSLVEGALNLSFPSGVAVLVRPRAGNFVHTSEEIAIIEATIRDYRLSVDKDAPIAFVVGVLEKNGMIHREAIRRFKEAAGDCDLVFHRAFDLLENQEEGVKILRELGVHRILTTGGDPKRANVLALRQLVAQAGEDMTILASGGLRSWNVADVVAQSGVREVHMRAPGSQDRTDPVQAAAIMSALTSSNW